MKKYPRENWQQLALENAAFLLRIVSKHVSGFLFAVGFTECCCIESSVEVVQWICFLLVEGLIGGCRWHITNQLGSECTTYIPGNVLGFWEVINGWKPCRNLVLYIKCLGLGTPCNKMGLDPVTSIWNHIKTIHIPVNSGCKLTYCTTKNGRPSTGTIWPCSLPATWSFRCSVLCLHPKVGPVADSKKNHGSLHGTHFGGGSNLMLMSGNSEGFPLKVV